MWLAPTEVERFEEVTVELLNDPTGLDLTGHRNMHVSLAVEKSDVTIEDFECMLQGVDYTKVHKTLDKIFFCVV